ncbi:MAG: ABC transporter substrate-binding protein [Dehalococcoidia bacterium]
MAQKGRWTATERSRVSRRRLLRGAIVGGGLSALAFAAACSGDSDGEAGSEQGQAGSADGTATKTAGTQEAKPGGVLKTPLAYDPETLDPIRTKSFRTSVVAAYTYSRLLRFKTGDGEPSDGSVVPDVAIKWEQPDPMTVIMEIREGMKFDQRAPTNGRTLTTEDVTLSWEKYATESTYRSDLVHAANPDASVTSLRALDDKRIEIKTAFPDAQLLPVLAFPFNFWILPKEAFAGGFDPATTMRGTGPWTLESYQPSVALRFKKNPNFYDAPKYPLADAIDVPIIVDNAQAIAQFQAKNLYWGGVPVIDIASLHKDLKDTRVDLDPPTTSGNSISFSWRESNPYRDKRVRQAISMLIERDTFIRLFNDVEAFESAGVKLNTYWNSPLSAGFGPFWLDPKSDSFGESGKNFKHNVAEAKKLLAAAGYPDGFEAPFTFVAGTTYGRDWGQRAEALMSMLSQGGIRTKANAIDYTSVWIPQYLRSQGDFDGMAMYPNGARGDPGQWVGVFLASSGANNQSGKMFPELDSFIEKQRGELDRDRRIAVFQDMQRWCGENMPIVPQAGHTEVPGLSWKALHGPEQYSAWPGDSYSSGVDLYPYYWLEDSLRG